MAGRKCSPDPRSVAVARAGAAEQQNRRKAGRKGNRSAPQASPPEARRERNRERLAAFTTCSDPLTRLTLRNALVADNLPLVCSLAGRLGGGTELPFEDLRQVGSMGLIRALEAFDPRHRTSLSSFAVPYIRGAIRHELRDRQHLMRIPRQIWELRQQVAGLQEGRRRQKRSALDRTRLATELGCRPEDLIEVETLRNVTAMRSLDAPLGSGDGEADSSSCLLDHLADPASLVPFSGIDDPVREERTAEVAWLHRQLAGLDPLERQLLEGRLQVGCTWVELGERLGLAPRQAQRRCSAALDRLQRAAGEWKRRSSEGDPTHQSRTSPATDRPMASRAEISV